MKRLRLNSNPYIVKNKNYSTITFNIIFPCNYDRKNMFNIIILREMLSNYSFNYKNEQEFKIEKEKRLIIDLYCKTKRFNNNMYIIFRFTVPDPKKIKDFDIEKSFEFLYEVIYKQNIINNEFDNKQFNRERDYVRFSTENSLKEIYTYGYQKFINEADDIGVLKDDIYDNLDLLEKTTPKELYEYYKNNILDNTPLCFAYGNVSKNYINNLYYKYFKKSNDKIIISKDYYSYLKPSKEVKTIETITNYNQSILYMAYKIDRMKERDELFFNILTNILNSKDTNLIFNKLRTEKNLIYSHSFDSYIKNGMFVIEAYVDKQNKDKTINAITEILDGLNNEIFIENCINKIIEGIEINKIDLLDSKYHLFSEFISNKLQLHLSLDSTYMSFKKVDIKEFMKFLNRVKLDTIYFLKGDRNE